MFPFLRHVQTFWCEILFVCRLKYPYSCFSSHFCFLVVVRLIFVLSVLSLIAVISLCSFSYSHKDLVLIQCWRVLLLYCHMLHHNDTIIKTQEDFFLNICTSHFICNGSKRVTRGLRVRGSWRPNINCNILTLPLWPSALCLSRSPGLLNRRPRGPLCWVMAFFTASYQHLLRTSTYQGLKALRPGVAFPTTSVLSPSPTLTGTGTVTWLLSWLSYIIVQRPLDRPLDLWNRMLDRHQAENNCHAVHKSLSSGASVYECIMGFTLSHFISQIHPRDLFRLLAIGMCHFLTVHHFVRACLLGSKVKIQHSSPFFSLLI